MANNTKPIEKTVFRATARRARRTAATQRSRSGEQARLLVQRDAIPTATGVAHRLGWLEHELTLAGTPLTVLSGREPSRADRDRLAVAGLIREGDHIAALWERSRGRDTRLIGLTWVDGFQAVVVAPDSGIGEPGQLAGHRLALPRLEDADLDVPRAEAYRGFHAATALAGLFGEEVAYVDVPVTRAAAERYDAELAALLRGEVDAVYVAGAAGAAAARIGAKTIADLGRNLDPTIRAGATTPAALTVDARLLEQQPLLVSRVLAVLLRTGAWAQQHPVETVEHVAAETGASLQATRAAHCRNVHEQLHVDLSDRKLAALRAQHEFLRTYGFLTSDVDLNAWIDPRPLAAARDLLAAERTAWV